MMLEFVKSGMRKFLGLQEKGSGSYSFMQYPIWGRFDKIKEGDYQSMVDSVVGWVYACINILAFNVAKVPFHVYKEQPNDEDRLIENHPLYDLVKYPNEYMKAWEFWWLVQGFLDGTGNAFIYHPLNGVKRPMELYLLPTNYVKMRIENGKFYYDYNAGGTIQTFTGEEVLHMKYPSIQNINMGVGPLEAARAGVNLDAYMTNYQISLLANRARPDVVLKTTESISPAEAKRTAKEFKKQYGGVDKAGGIAVLGSNLDITTIGLNPADLEYLKSREFNKDEIAGIFNIPPYKLGKVEKVNMANAHELEHSFQADTIKPRLIMRDQYLTSLVQLYDPRLIIKSDNIVPRDREFELKQEEIDLRLGVVSRNEIRTKRGLDKVKGADELYIPFNMVPMGTASVMYQKPEDSKKPEKPEKTYIEDVRSREIESYAKIAFGKTMTRKQFKEHYWKAYVRKTEVEERLMISKLKPYFEEQMRLVISNLRKYHKGYKIDISFILFSMAAWNKKLDGTMEPLCRASVIGGAESLIEDFGLGITFDVSSPFVADFFAMRENKINHINRVTFDQLTVTLEQGIRDGETITQLAKRVEFVYDEAKGYRAKLIARTETNTANNFGHMAAMYQAGIEKKEWVTAHDDQVRDEHEQNELAGCIPITETFPGTGEEYPGEPNCRCTVIPCLEAIGA
jgi:HK97 family phage portal protein